MRARPANPKRWAGRWRSPPTPPRRRRGSRTGSSRRLRRRGTGSVLGGVVVAPRASELILGVSLAVEQSLTVDQMAHTFAVYPSLSGSLTEAARRLMRPSDVN